MCCPITTPQFVLQHLPVLPHHRFVDLGLPWQSGVGIAPEPAWTGSPHIWLWEWPQLSGGKGREGYGKNTLFLNNSLAPFHPTPVHSSQLSSGHMVPMGAESKTGHSSADHSAHTHSKLLFHHQWENDHASVLTTSGHFLASHREFYKQYSHSVGEETEAQSNHLYKQLLRSSRHRALLMLAHYILGQVLRVLQ